MPKKKLFNKLLFLTLIIIVLKKKKKYHESYNINWKPEGAVEGRQGHCSKKLPRKGLIASEGKLFSIILG